MSVYQNTITNIHEKVNSAVSIYSKQDTYAINDPLGQTHIHASSDHYSLLNFVLFCEILRVGTHGPTYRQHVRKIVIIRGLDCGSASWIKRKK